MTSIIEQTPSSTSKKHIPHNAIIIEINDDQQQQGISDNQFALLTENQYIQEAILTKNIDNLKRAIFTILYRRRFKYDKKEAEKSIRSQYIEYFKQKLEIDISRAFYRSPLQIQDSNTQPDFYHIVVHGVDLLSNSQLQNKFKGAHPVTIERINPSNVSIKFNPSQNIEDILYLMKERKKDPDLNEIEQEGWSKWKPLKKYQVLGFQRPLKFRFAGQNQKFTQKEDYNLKNFQIQKGKIQESDKFITCKDDKDFYDQMMEKFQDALLPMRARYARNSRRSEHGQSERSRTRDRRYGDRNENFEGRYHKIEDFDRKFNRNDRNDRGQRGNFTDRGNFTERNRGGYQTERGNFDRRSQNREGGWDNQNRSNFRRNDLDQNNPRENRFFNKEKNKNASRIEEEKDFSRSYEIPKKSVSKSKSKSNSSKSKSFKLNESFEAPFNPANVSMSFVYPDKTEAIINQDVSQSFVLNPAMNNLFNPTSDVSQSFIVPSQYFHKQEEDDNKSNNSADELNNFLKNLDEEKKQELQKKRKRSRSNSSVGSRSVASRNKNSDKNRKAESIRGSNKGSQRSFNNNRDNQRESNYNNRQGYGGRGNFNFNNRNNSDYGNKGNYNDRVRNLNNGESSNNGGGYERRNYSNKNNRNEQNRNDNRNNGDFDNHERNRDFNKRNNYNNGDGQNNDRGNGGNRFNNYTNKNQYERGNQNRNFNRNYNNNNRNDKNEGNRNDRNENNRNDNFNKRNGRHNSNAYDQYDRKEKSKPIDNLLDEDQIDY